VAASAQQPARLHVEVLTVTCLPLPMPSLHELVSALASKELLPPEMVFAELEVGARCVETTRMPILSGGHCVRFIQEVLLFSYSGEDAMELRVGRTRWPQELEGDEFIGLGRLKLGCGPRSWEPRTVDVPVSSSGIVTGVVSLRHQLFV